MLDQLRGRRVLVQPEPDLRPDQEKERQDHDTPIADRGDRGMVAIELSTGTRLNPLTGRAFAGGECYTVETDAEGVMVAASADGRVARDLRACGQLIPYQMRSDASTTGNVVRAVPRQGIATGTGGFEARRIDRRATRILSAESTAIRFAVRLGLIFRAVSVDC